jgi:hypothetical protein
VEDNKADVSVGTASANRSCFVVDRDFKNQRRDEGGVLAPGETDEPRTGIFKIQGMEGSGQFGIHPGEGRLSKALSG